MIIINILHHIVYTIHTYILTNNDTANGTGFVGTEERTIFGRSPAMSVDKSLLWSAIDEKSTDLYFSILAHGVYGRMRQTDMFIVSA